VDSQWLPSGTGSQSEEARQVRDHLRTEEVEAIMIGVVIDLILLVGAIMLFKKYRKPRPHALVVVFPGHRFNRLQYAALIYLTLSAVLGVAILILDSSHLAASIRTAKFLGGEAVVFVIFGVVMFLVGWIRRRKPDISSLN